MILKKKLFCQFKCFGTNDLGMPNSLDKDIVGYIKTVSSRGAAVAQW
jgi:hypothetical protein